MYPSAIAVAQTMKIAQRPPTSAMPQRHLMAEELYPPSPLCVIRADRLNRRPYRNDVVIAINALIVGLLQRRLLMASSTRY